MANCISLGNNMREIRYLVVHCSATAPQLDVGADDIREWHRTKGWKDIGYHYVIKRDGTLEKGRDDEVVGAHVEGFNTHSIGICLAGGVDLKSNPAANFSFYQYATLHELLQDLMKRYPQAAVMGHRDFPKVDKACPSFDVKSFMEMRT